MSDEFNQAAALEELSARIQMPVRSLERLAAASSELREVLTDLSGCRATLAQLAHAHAHAEAIDLTAVREYRDLVRQLSEEAKRLVLNGPHLVLDTLVNQKDETE